MRYVFFNVYTVCLLPLIILQFWACFSKILTYYYWEMVGVWITLCSFSYRLV